MDMEMVMTYFRQYTSICLEGQQSQENLRRASHRLRFEPGSTKESVIHYLTIFSGTRHVTYLLQPLKLNLWI
jgi:hypothetical protein